jgi:hypothetical protein
MKVLARKRILMHRHEETASEIAVATSGPPSLSKHNHKRKTKRQ